MIKDTPVSPITAYIKLEILLDFVFFVVLKFVVFSNATTEEPVINELKATMLFKLVT